MVRIQNLQTILRAFFKFNFLFFYFFNFNEIFLFIRKGTGRRDSAAQITSISPPNELQETSPTNQRRRRSSLAQLTDILREWGGGGMSTKGGKGSKLSRRETLADIAKSLPWSRSATTDTCHHTSHYASVRKRRESSVDSGIRSQLSTKGRRDSAISDLKNDIAKLWGKKEQPQAQQPPTVISPTPRRGINFFFLSKSFFFFLIPRLEIYLIYQNYLPPGSGESRNSRRGSGESARSRRDSIVGGQTGNLGEKKQHNCRHHRRKQSQQSIDLGVPPGKYYRNDQRPSASSTDSGGSFAIRLVIMKPSHRKQIFLIHFPSFDFGKVHKV